MNRSRFLLTSATAAGFRRLFSSSSTMFEPASSGTASGLGSHLSQLSVYATGISGSSVGTPSWSRIFERAQAMREISGPRDTRSYTCTGTTATGCPTASPRRRCLRYGISASTRRRFSNLGTAASCISLKRCCATRPAIRSLPCRIGTTIKTRTYQKSLPIRPSREASPIHFTGQTESAALWRD